MIPFQHGVFATSSAAAGGFEAIATVTAAGGEASLTFSSIPQTYASLQIRGIGKDLYSGAAAADYVNIRFNNDSSANYARHYLQGNGSTVQAGGGTGDTSIYALYAQTYSHNGNANIYGSMIVDIHDYASTTRNKTARIIAGTDNNVASSAYAVCLQSGLWLSTSAVTSITLLSGGGTGWAAGSKYALYGIKAAA